MFGICCILGFMKNQEIQLGYTVYVSGCQLKLLIETEIFTPKDDPVKLLISVNPSYTLTLSTLMCVLVKNVKDLVATFLQL